MNSKCAVSPRIRQPEADDRVESPALGRVLRRQRNLEGARHARTSVTSLAATPAAASAASAPACRRSVMKSLYFDTTSANRNPAARPDP